MNVGLGVDIVEISRMGEVIARSNAFVTRVYTTNEQLYCSKKARPDMHYAARFAAKEAAAKALGTGLFAHGVRPIDIEVIHDDKGKPAILLHGAAAARAKEQQVLDMPLSLSYTHTVAVANVVAITQEAKVEREKKQDSHDEITRQFKDARAFIDQLSRGTADALVGDKE